MKIKIGDHIRYKMWSGKMVTAGVLGIEICKEGMKSGRPVSQCDLEKHNNVVLDLDNQHWAYGYQVKEILS